MTLRLLLKKMYLDEKKIVTANILKAYCKDLALDYYATIRYLIRNKYLHRILRGIFYFPGVEERKLNRIDIGYLDALAMALRIKGVKNWYLGLETAAKMNAMTHEFITIEYIMNDALFRARVIKVLGHNIKFVKLKKNLFGFGIIAKTIRYSDPEKTVLDMIYLSRYRGMSISEIKIKIADFLKYCSPKKLLAYAKHYNKTTELFVKGL